MKKLLTLSFALGLGLQLYAADHTSQSFLPAGVVCEVITNATTSSITNAVYGGSNNVVSLLIGSTFPTTYGSYSQLWAYGTNVFGQSVIGGGSSNTIVAYGTNEYLLSPQLYGVQGTNMFFIVYTNNDGYGALVTNQGAASTNWSVISPGNFKDVKNTADGLGDINSNQTITIAVASDGSGQTNKLTFLFERACANLISQYYPQIISGPNYGNTNTADLWSVTVGPLNGTNEVVFTTNLSSTFAAGAESYRLVSIAQTTNTANGTNIYIHEVSLGSFTP